MNFKSKVGTFGYIAPEILRGNECGTAADIWSLGCLLYALLTATLPFERMTAKNVVSVAPAGPDNKAQSQLYKGEVKLKEFDDVESLECRDLL